jgi:hypothetical protein
MFCRLKFRFANSPQKPTFNLLTASFPQTFAEYGWLAEQQGKVNLKR